MYTKVYWIHTDPAGGRIGIMPRPRGDDWLADEITNLKRQGTNVLVSLLENQEIAELGLRSEESLCKGANIEFIHQPIPDRGVPDSSHNIDALLRLLSLRMEEGKSIVVHCRMGIGRSSIIAGALLTQKGLKADEVIARIIQVRGLNVPDTEVQLDWLRKWEL